MSNELYKPMSQMLLANTGYMESRWHVQGIIKMMQPQIAEVQPRIASALMDHMNQVTGAHRIVEKTIASQVNSLAPLFNSVEKLNNSIASQWMAENTRTAELFREMMQSITRNIGVKIEVPNVQLFMQNAPRLKDELEGSELDDAADSLVASAPELAVAIQRQAELLVDYTDPAQQAMIVWGLKISVYLIFASVIVGFAPYEALAVALLSFLGITAPTIANCVGGKAAKALEKRAGQDESEE